MPGDMPMRAATARGSSPEVAGDLHRDNFPGAMADHIADPAPAEVVEGPLPAQQMTGRWRRFIDRLFDDHPRERDHEARRAPPGEPLSAPVVADSPSGRSTTTRRAPYRSSAP
jgi:hypothetical protein